MHVISDLQGDSRNSNALEEFQEIKDKVVAEVTSGIWVPWLTRWFLYSAGIWWRPDIYCDVEKVQATRTVGHVFAGLRPTCTWLLSVFLRFTETTTHRMESMVCASPVYSKRYLMSPPSNFILCSWASSESVHLGCSLTHQFQLVYCTISFNSAPCVTRYQLAEILISAGPRFERDIQIFSAGRV